MIFKYSQYPTIEGGNVFRPSIPITFKLGEKNIHVEALVDSGADLTVLPIEMADVFDFSLRDEPKHLIQAAGGNQFYIHKSPVQIEHIIKRSGFRPIKWKSYVYFAQNQPAILLGQLGFLDRFDIRMNGPKKELTISTDR